MMKTWQMLPLVFVACCLPGGSTARAQDTITDILRKATLTSQDRGTLEAEVGQRVKRTFGGSGDPNINDARDRLLKPTKEKDISKEGLRVYAEILSAELEPQSAAANLGTALTAALLIEELESESCVTALASSMKSKHPSVRYTAARGLGTLWPKISADEAACRAALTALGKAGASEKDEQVLRRIYTSLNVRAVASDFKLMDAAAAALNDILATRTRALAEGSQDEYREDDALAAIVGCYGGATERHRNNLARHLFAIYSHTLDHYFDAGTAVESLPTIARIAQRVEKSIHDIMKASSVSPPARLASEQLKGTDRQKAEKEVRDGAEALRKLLGGDPWNLS